MDILFDFLVDDYIIEVDKNKYKFNNYGIEMIGIFQCKSNGKNFFIFEGGGDLIFVVECNFVYVMNNDKVCIVFYVKCCGCEVEGEVIEILQCVNDIFVGILEVEKLYVFFVMENCMFVNDIFIFKDKLKGGKIGDKVVVKVIEWLDKVKNLIGQVFDIFGKVGDNIIEMYVILVEFGLLYVYL